jgi:hypothetical protein
MDVDGPEEEVKGAAETSRSLRMSQLLNALPTGDAAESSHSNNNNSADSIMDSARSTTSVNLDAAMLDLCHKCDEKPGTYTPNPCGCYRVCKQCAMKLSTGGKCSVCKGFYISLVPVDQNTNETREAEPHPMTGDNTKDVIVIDAHSCQRCNSGPALFQSVPCGCYKVCRKCAMKMATGGKCATCKEYYTQFGAIPGTES